MLASGSYYGKLMLFIGFLVAIPLLVLPFFPSEIRYAPSFLVPSIISILLGFSTCAFTYKRKSDKDISAWQKPTQSGSLPVLFVWCSGFVFGSIPFVIGGQLSVIHSLFESISGWTTAGMSIVDDVHSMPGIFLFHRSFMQYCGGLGFILMIVMFTHSRQDMNLYSAEGHSDRIMPNLVTMSRRIFSLYVCFLVIGVLLYLICGMDLFDAICHAMSALSTAGFTTKADSIGAYGSFAIEGVTILLMLIGASNFAVILLLTEGKIRLVFRVTEMRFLFCLIVVFVPLVTFSLASKHDFGLGSAFRHALFGVVATISTSGYKTMDYFTWPPFAFGLIMLLMFIGGSSGSTSGGIKLSRAYFLIRITRENVISRFSPRRKVTSPHYYSVRGRMPIDNSLIADTFGFVACYAGVVILGTLLLTLTAECSLYDAFFEFSSALSTVGMSNGLASSSTSVGSLAVLMAGMLLGRLEVLIVFVGVATGVHKIRQQFANRSKS